MAAMHQAKINLTPPLVEFLSQYEIYGFRDESEMVRNALQCLREEMELQSLRDSADLYEENYQGDDELRELTAAALVEWPE